MRILIETGIMNEYARAMAGTEAILAEWRSGAGDNRENYMKMYQHVEQRDKEIERRYDRLSGSNYQFILASQFNDGLITIEDLEALPERVREALRFFREG